MKKASDLPCLIIIISMVVAGLFVLNFFPLETRISKFYSPLRQHPPQPGVLVSSREASLDKDSEQVFLEQQKIRAPVELTRNFQRSSFVSEAWFKDTSNFIERKFQEESLKNSQEPIEKDLPELVRLKNKIGKPIQLEATQSCENLQKPPPIEIATTSRSVSNSPARKRKLLKNVKKKINNFLLIKKPSK